MLADIRNNIQNPAKMRWVIRNAMLFNKYGDFAGIVVAGQGIYSRIKDSLIRGGMDPEAARVEAQHQFWQIAEQAQQSSLVTNQSVSVRRGGTPARFLGQFTSTPGQFIAKEVLTAIELYNGKISKTQAAQVFLANHIILPLFYHGVNIIIDRLQGDEVDEDEGLLLLSAFIAGPLSGWFVVGNALTGILDIIIQGGGGRGGDLVPASGAVNDIGDPLADIFRFLSGVLRGEGDASENFWKAMQEQALDATPLGRDIKKFTDDE